MVKLIHSDGSIFNFERALPRNVFFEEDKSFWWVVFTEHHGINVFHSDDVKHIHTYIHVDMNKDNLIL